MRVYYVVITFNFMWWQVLHFTVISVPSAKVTPMKCLVDTYVHYLTPLTLVPRYKPLLLFLA